MRILISGGPGSGCTSTAAAVGAALNLPVFDSDSYFHKPTDPPFQQQYTPEERRELLSAALVAHQSWILSGSVSRWEIPQLHPTHGIFLQVPREERLRRLQLRQQAQFGSRIDPGGDMQEEHHAFLQWAAAYETRNRQSSSRNLTVDRSFLEHQCPHLLILSEIEPLESIVTKAIEFLRTRPVAPY